MLKLNSRTAPDLDEHYSAPRMRRGPLPTISVVSIAGVEVGATLRRMSLCYARWAKMGVEVIVICNGGQEWLPSHGHSAGLRVIQGPADATDSQLRAIGLAAASGDLVMLLDDLAAADDEWIEHLCGAGREYGSAPDLELDLPETRISASRSLFAAQPSV